MRRPIRETTWRRREGGREGGVGGRHSINKCKEAVFSHKREQKGRKKGGREGGREGGRLTLRLSASEPTWPWT